MQLMNYLINTFACVVYLLATVMYFHSQSQNNLSSDDIVKIKFLIIFACLSSGLSIGLSLKNKSSISTKDIIQTIAVYLSILSVIALLITEQRFNGWSLIIITPSIIMSSFAIDLK
jgi:hypothetical protein